MEKALFNIDYTKWSLPKSSETGLPIEPIKSDDFIKFEYWRNQFNQPIRQIICKSNKLGYVDCLNVNTASLYRTHNSLLGVSPYDDEITKEQYEKLCQTTLLYHYYKKEINYEALLPFQLKAITFLKYNETVFIRKLNTLYTVNINEQLLEKTTLFSIDIMDKAVLISEYEFYYTIIKMLIDKNGDKFLAKGT